MTYHVYTLTFADKATYVGSTRDTTERFRSHIKKLRNGKHSANVMAAYLKQGMPKFTTVAETDDLATLHVLEQQVMDNTDNLLNTQPAQPHCGEKQSVAAQCRVHGVDPIIYYWRLRHNWTHDEALGITERVKTVQQKLITVNGKTLPINAWAEKIGVRPNVIHNRIASGWSEQDAVTTPKRVQSPKADKQPRVNKVYTVQGQSGTIRELAEHFGISASLLRSRLDAGWSDADLLRKAGRVSVLNIEPNTWSPRKGFTAPV